MKNQLSEIYSNKILLNEEKSSIVKTSKELDSKIGKASLVKGQGAEKSKKDVGTPSEDKKYSNGSNAKEMKESVKSYEGAFEKLFKATINEQEMEDQEVEMDIEIPTTGDEMADELGSEEETSDLVSDLREVMDRLQDILGKLSEDEGETEEENEVEESEETESNEESDEEPYQESVSMEDKGHALHNMKAGTDLMSKGKYQVPGKLKPSKGTPHKGELKDSPEPKELGDKKSSLMGKKSMAVNSSVKTGDFFK